ncbi:6975_t:CDS:2 [Ambispora gerdemannii]|uniref:6975_t:CDS:1 n=1 Tax=Ambispora gerdemannii TaxID=144530 RepID=A0A9N8YKH6_9GLOM|nr:6975_t:CDS:2 [Ambispora gerdemannii]
MHDIQALQSIGGLEFGREKTRHLSREEWISAWNEAVVRDKHGYERLIFDFESEVENHMTSLITYHLYKCPPPLSPSPPIITI